MLRSKATIVWCNDYICLLLQLGLHSHRSKVHRGVLWIVYESCQCTLPYDFSVKDSYFICTASDYVIFRAKLSASFDSLVAMDLKSLKASLSNFFIRQDGKIHITINGGGYFIEPGPCGLTVPELTSPHCLDNAPTQAAVATPPQDNTVTTVVAIMITAIVLVVLVGCIVFLVIGLWKM